MIYKLIILNDEGGVEEVINFDVVQNMDESGSSTLPSSPVEEGLVFDHSYSGNTKFSMSAIYTDVGFRKRSKLITYRNGMFVKKYPEEADDTNVENRVQVMKARIKEIREKGILFGLAECTEHDPNNPDDTSSQINFYYPCGFTDVSFPYKDGGDAIYPSMSIEVLRVTEVQTATVENPSPELIPYVRHGDQGGASGSSGGASVGAEASGDDVINQIKNDAKAFSGSSTEKLEDSTSKKMTDQLHSERDRQKSAIAKMDKVISDLGNGSITKDQSNAQHIEIERNLNSSVPYK